MRRRLKRAVLLLLSALAALLMLVGCELGVTKQEAINGQNLKASVTYYANGGEFSSGAKFQEIWYRENSMPIDMVNDSHMSGTTIKLTRKNYKFLQWYHVLETGVNEDGSPILDMRYDEKTQQTFYTPDRNRPVDFNTQLKEGDHWYICADWEAKLMVRAYLVSDSPVQDGTQTYYPITSEEAQEDNEAALLAMYRFKNEVADMALDWRPVKPTSDHTFVGFYYDVDCTELISENIVMGEEDVTVYAKYLEGEWNIIREAKDVKAIFQSRSADDKFYFISDIDMTGVSCGLRLPRETKCTILGNGYTVKNLTIEQSTKQNVSLFGAISETAVIENLTFENVTCNWTFQKPTAETYLSVYMICASVANGAKIENVTFTGELSVNLNLPKENVILVNFEGVDGGYKYTSCLFGGESDEAYTTANPNGFKLVGDPENIINIKQ